MQNDKIYIYINHQSFLTQKLKQTKKLNFRKKKNCIANLRIGERGTVLAIVAVVVVCVQLWHNKSGVEFKKSQIRIVSSCELLTIWNSSNCSRNTRPVCSCIEKNHDVSVTMQNRYKTHLQPMFLDIKNRLGRADPTPPTDPKL